MQPLLIWTLVSVMLAADRNVQALIPDPISECYRTENSYLFNRHNRQAMSMDQLIGLVEKLEHTSAAYFLSPQRIASTLLWRFRYDGIVDQAVNPGSPYLSPFSINQPENAKYQMLRRLISMGTRHDFPEDEFSLEEKCTLHWLLSHTINETVRGDENQFCRRSSKRSAYVESYLGDVVSVCPLESGVVYSTYGPVAAGTLLAGIAAGLSEQDVSVEDVVGRNTITLQSYTNYQKQLTVNNVWAATLAGDIAQTALYYGGAAADWGSVIGPGGHWNSTYCPREYSLHSPEAITALTNAEIYAGIDGLLLGSVVSTWSRETSFSLSRVLKMYYSPEGVSYDSRFRACDRLSNYRNPDLLDRNELKNQAVHFAFAYYAADLGRMPMLDASSLDEGIDVMVSATIRQLDSFADGDMSDEGVGCRQLPAANQLVCDTKTDLHVILDPSQGASSLQAQKIFLSEMTLSLDIGWNRSYLQVVDGGDGNVLIDLWNFTNKAWLACHIDHLQVLSRRSDYGMALDVMINYFSNMMEKETHDSASSSSTQVLLMLYAGSRVEDEQQMALRLAELCRIFPDVNIVALAPNTGVFRGVRERLNRPQFSQQSLFAMETSDREIRDTLVPKLTTHICKMASRFVYPACDESKRRKQRFYRESSHVYRGYTRPGRITYLRAGPQQFHSSTDLNIKFDAGFGSILVCRSRTNPTPGSDGHGDDCKTADAVRSVEFRFIAPCDGDRTVEDCHPIYFSIQENTQTQPSGYTNQCTDEDCPYPNSVKFSIVHRNMRCSLASGHFTGGYHIIAALFFSVILYGCVL